MQLGWGAYKWNPNSTELNTRRQVLWNEGGQPYAYKLAFDATGYLLPTSQADCSTKMAALSAALSIPYQTLTLYHDDGSPSAAIMPNVGSRTGVRVVAGPDFPSSIGAEFISQRKWHATFEAEYAFSFAGNFLLSFHESLSFSGGFPRYVDLEALNTIAQHQRVCFREAYKATQAGSIVGYLRYAAVPVSKWPRWLAKSPDIQQKSPKREGQGYSGFETTYSYSHSSPNPLVGVPNLWIN